MFRLKKLLGILIVLGIVFFIICDEKGYKLGFENNHIVLNEPEKKSELVVEEDPFKEVVYKNSDLILINYEFKNPRNLRKSNGIIVPEKVIVYKNSNRIKLYSGFYNPITLRNSSGIDEEYIARNQEKVYTGPNIIAINNKDNTISSVFQGRETQDNEGTTKPEIKENTGAAKPEVKESTGTTKLEIKENTGATKPEIKQDTGTAKPEIKENTGTAELEVNQNTGTVKPEIKENTGTAKPEIKENTGTAKPEVNQNTGTTKPEIKENTGTAKPEIKENTGIAEPEVKENTGTTEPEVKQDTGTVNTGKTTEEVQLPKTYTIEKYEHKEIALNLSKGVEIPKVKIEKYSGKENLALNLSKGKEIEPKKKNSNRIKLYSGFDNPRNMRGSAGIDEEFLAKQQNTKTTFVSLNDDTISSARQNTNIDNNVIQDGDIDEDTQNIEENTLDNIPEDNNLELNEIETGDIVESENEENTYKIEKYQHTNHEINIKEAEEIIPSNNKIEDNNIISEEVEAEEVESRENEEVELIPDTVEVNEGSPEVSLVKIEKYQPIKQDLRLRKGKVIKHDFIVENTELQQPESGLSDSLLESLLENEEINIDTIESENDEFLQKVFEKTKDRDVMNLIVETYLNEYQFVKAKKFIENLTDEYRDELKPSLNLRVAFNSFALSSKNITENLNLMLQEYNSKGIILDEDNNRYQGILALMDRNYDKFFEIAAGFTSDNHKAFASKLQGYKDQIAKQMGMPQYYFDTLVSLELFNQGLFQPAKVLALYSLQQNANYILPYQVLAYANFLTNSRDTSVEYLKKLVDLDPNNAEKYRFLMGVASYRDEKYEQSVVMLSMIKDEKLRLDTQRYLINDYLKLQQKNKLISSRNKLLGYENLVASDFYTYFYETFFHPYSQGEEFQLYVLDTELANKMLRVCSMTLQNEDKAVCTYGTIGRNIALGQFDGMEQYLLDLISEYPQGYLYQALGEYYIKQREMDKAKAYLLKAVSLSQSKSEKSQIKKLLQETM